MSYLNWLEARMRPTETAPLLIQATEVLANAILAGSHKVEIPEGFFGGLQVTVIREGILPPGCLGVMASPAEPKKFFLLMETPTPPPNAEESHLPA